MPARYYTVSQLLSRGWTRTLIRRALRKPDRWLSTAVGNIGLYLVPRVEGAEDFCLPVAAQLARYWDRRAEDALELTRRYCDRATYLQDLLERAKGKTSG